MIVMKKAIILTILIVILATALTITPYCFADTISASNNFYEVTDTNGLQTYAKTSDTTFVESIIIPYSYFFKIVEKADEYYRISYNDYDQLYVAEATLSQSIRSTAIENASSFKVGPYYTLPLTAPATTLQLYNMNYDADAANVFNSLSFIGYALHNEEYYFLAKETIVMGGVNYDAYLYVKASDVLSSSFDPKKIELNPDSQQAKNEEKEKNVEKAQNKLRRNMFIIVLCISCVLVTVLIYNPFKKKSQSRPANSITTNDDI